MKYGIEAIKKLAADFDVPLTWAIERWQTFFNSQITYIRSHQRGLIQQMSSADMYSRDFIFSALQDCKKEIHDYERKLYLIENIDRVKKGEITDEMIEQAREYPIEQLLEVKRNMALCINHSERKPSMNCKNNFAYCHSCGWSGDTISVFMKIHGCNFMDAVRALQ